MKSLIPLFPFVAALGLIACQGNDGPVAKGATAPPDNVVGDAAATGLATPANAAAAEATARAATPIAEDGLVWTATPDGARISFGPAGRAPMLAFACQGTATARHILVTRFDPTHAGATATLSFTGGGHASSLPMHGVAKPGGPGDSDWQGDARGDMARAVARAFAGQGVVNVTLGGAPPLAVPTSPQASAFFKRCG